MGVTPPDWDDFYHEDYDGCEHGFQDRDDYWDHIKPVESEK